MTTPKPNDPRSQSDPQTPSGTQPPLPNQPVIPNQPVTNKPAAPKQQDGRKQPPPSQPAKNEPAAPAGKAQRAHNRPRPVESRPVPVKPKSELAIDAAEEDEHEVADEIVRQVPSWVISAAVHALLIFILVLIPLLDDEPQRLTLETVEHAEDIGEQLDDESLDDLALDAVDPDVTEPIISEDDFEVEDPLASSINLTNILSELQVFEPFEAPSRGFAFRTDEGSKAQRLAKYGGNEKTEAAVRRGLEWLKRNQTRDGSWSLLEPYADGAGLGVGIENKAAATAMALLAFQGAGNTHETGEFRDVVAKGWKALLQMQGSDGNFYSGNAPRQSLYTQAQCTIAVCEMYGMTQDEQFKEPAELAIEYCLDAQAPQGGWKYHPRTHSDLSVTGWFVMALMSAKMAGLDVPDETLDGVRRFLDTVSTGDGSRYYYQPGYIPTPAMTAEGLLCRQYLGWEQDDPRLLAGVKYLLDHPIDYVGSDEFPSDVYYWYYATQVMHHLGGPAWTQWNKVMRQEIPNHQVTTGREQGSWDPQGDKHRIQGGRLYVTCLSIYMLEVYYRHLPIYSYRATKTDE